MSALPPWAGRIAISTGEVVNILDLPDSALAVHVLAHALARINRYTGHASRAYSVAEHSLVVAAMVPPAHRLAALLHDAPEAFTNDMAKPLKVLPLMSGYGEIESIVAARVASHFGLATLEPPVVKQADFWALGIEARELFPERAWTWFPPPPEDPYVAEIGAAVLGIANPENAWKCAVSAALAARNPETQGDSQWPTPR